MKYDDLRDFMAVLEARGELPNLILICLPNDHTSGTKPGVPTPADKVGTSSAEKP